MNEPKPITDPLQAIISRIEAKRSGLPVEEHAKAVVAEVKAAVAPAGRLPAERGWITFAPVPSDLCRVSPFFPMSKAEIAKRPFVEDLVIAKSSWGELRYTGPKLDTFTEDVFLAVLALIDDPAERKNLVEVDGVSTTAWTGPVGQILALMGVTDGAANYARVRRAFKHMRATTFEIQLKSGRIEGCGLLAGYGFDLKTKQAIVTVDPVFHGLYSQGSVTKLDVERRSKLPGAVAKCVYRFAMSHRNDRWEGHWMTLARAINLDMDRPDKKLRYLLRTALTALVKSGVLTSGTLDGDIVTMVRASRSLRDRNP